MAPKKFFVLTLKSNVPKASPEELEKQCGDVVVEGIREVFAAAVAAKQSHAVSDLSNVADPVRRGELAIHRCLPQTFSFHTVFESGKDWYHLATARMLQRVQDCLNTQIPLTVDAFLRSCVHPDTPTEVVVTHSEALSAIASVWNFVVASLRLISHLLSHFDNAYCRTHVNNAGVEGLGVAMLIRDVRNPFEPVFRAATTGFLEAVAEDREGNAVSRGEMASFRVLAVAMNRFHPDIELAVKTQADAHFTRLGNLMVYQDRLTIEQFTQRCEAELAAERHRVAAYGHTSTRSVIEAIVQERLIKPHVAYMANQGLKGLVQNRSYSTVTSLYRLARLESVKQEEAIKRAFREYVGKTAAELVGAQDMEDTLIDMLIAHNKTCSEFVSSCFTGVAADSFGIAKKEAFEGAIRPKQNKCAELLAKYLDGYLRGNGGSDGGVCEAEQIDQALTSAMELFDFIPSKDVFEAFYAKDFGKRLILQRSVGVEHERIVIDKLRLVCGPSIAVKLNGMMKDIDVSRELTNLFKQTRYVRPTPTANNGENGRSPGVKHSDPAATTSTLSDTQNSNNTMDRTYSELGPAQPSLMGFDLDAPPLPRDDSSPCLPVASPVSTDTENSANGGSANVSMANCGFDFNPTVLTHGYWPSYPDFSPQLPSNVSRQMELFKIFYCSKHSSRKLSWQFSLSHCVLRAVFPKTKKELVVSFLQAIMLLQFNNEDSLTYGELLARLGIQPCEEATCAIIGLYAGNAKLLLREKAEGLPPLPPPKKGEPRTVVRAEDRIQYNAAFTHRLTKIRVNQVQLKETKEETQETTEKVLAERHYVVDAAIVRFMKSRKQSNHNELVSEVVGMLRFAAQPSDIKKRIEVLIERDYLERDSRDPSLYRYLA